MNMNIISRLYCKKLWKEKELGGQYVLEYVYVPYQYRLQYVDIISKMLYYYNVIHKCDHLYLAPGVNRHLTAL